MRNSSLQLPNVSGWPWRLTNKESKTGEDGSYQMAQVDHGDGRRKKSKTRKGGSYHTAQVGPGDGRKKEIRRARLEHQIQPTWAQKRGKNYVAQTCACSKLVLGS